MALREAARLDVSQPQRLSSLFVVPSIVITSRVRHYGALLFFVSPALWTKAAVEVIYGGHRIPVALATA